MPISGSKYEKWLTTEHLDVAEDYLRKAAPYKGTRFHKVQKLTAMKPYIRHASREGMGAAAEYGEYEAPPVDQPIPGPEKVVWPVQVGLMAQITGRMVRNKEVAKIKDIGRDISHSMKLAMEYKLHEWVADGFTAGSKFTTADGKIVFTTDHVRPGGQTYDTVYAAATEFNWQNLIDAITFVRTTHKDGNGNPLNYMYGKILLLHGEKLAKRIYEALQPGNRPETSNITRNYVNTFNIEPIMSQFIPDERWVLMDAEGHMAILGERVPTQVFTETVFTTRMNRTMAEYQNAVLEGWGLLGSQGPANTQTM